MASVDNTYYIQALDNYEFSLAETVEALNYALSYDPNHAPSHCLMGRIYMDHLLELVSAREHFEKALENDMENASVYKWYSLLLIKLADYAQAEKLIKHSFEVEGIDKGVMLQRQALLAECKGEFKQAKALLKQAIKTSFFNDHIDFLKDELSRVKDKMGRPKKKANKNDGDKKAQEKKETKTT